MDRHARFGSMGSITCSDTNQGNLSLSGGLTQLLSSAGLCAMHVKSPPPGESLLVWWERLCTMFIKLPPEGSLTWSGGRGCAIINEGNMLVIHTSQGFACAGLMARRMNVCFVGMERENVLSRHLVASTLYVHIKAHGCCQMMSGVLLVRNAVWHLTRGTSTASLL